MTFVVVIVVVEKPQKQVRKTQTTKLKTTDWSLMPTSNETDQNTTNTHVRNNSHRKEDTVTYSTLMQSPVYFDLC